MNVLNIDKLKFLCTVWQERLGILHWEIGLRICRERDMPIKNTQCAIDFSLSTERATISIIDPLDYPDTPFEQDMEV